MKTIKVIQFKKVEVNSILLFIDGVKHSSSWIKSEMKGSKKSFLKVCIYIVKEMILNIRSLKGGIRIWMYDVADYTTDRIANIPR